MADDLSYELLEAIVDRLAYLIEIDEAGWPAVAQYLGNRALEDGIDLFADFENPKAWATSAVDALRHHIRPGQFPGDV